MPNVTDGSIDDTTSFNSRTADRFTFARNSLLKEISPQDMGLVQRGHPVASGGTRVGLPGVLFNDTSTLAVTTDTIYYAPFLVTDPITVDACICEVTSGAGTIARMGILSADTAWQPSAVIQDASTVNPSGAAVLTASFTGKVLQPGRYLTAIVANGAATFRLVRGGITTGEVASALGSNPLIIRHQKASVGTGALGTTAWDTAQGGTVNHHHMVFLRLTGV